MASRLAGYGHRAPRVARRRAIVFSSLVGISMILMIASATAPVAEVQRGLAFALAPFAEAVNGVGREVRSIVDAAAEMDRLRRDNASLRHENERLEQRNRTLDALAVENEVLTALLAIRNTLEYSTVAARVIARELADVSRVVMIDAGSDDGLEIGDVVVGAGGALAGRVTELGASAARVTLISDPASTVIGETVGSRATGEVVGDLGGTLVMSKIDATRQVVLGEEVITAGLTLGDGIRSPYPRGLIIGRIIDVTRDPNAVVQTAFVDPAIDLDRLEALLVITDYEGGIPGGDLLPTDDLNPDGTLPDSERPFATPAPSPRLTPRP
ncbi:MAG TPA: rod shape-determining protein MreC [Patescibacteria group bacterium]|nr:rod shape-determining protein MreC [Patescibacteria group bacterium]